MPQVVLLVGPEGIGKRKIVHYLAQRFMCDQSIFTGEVEGESETGVNLFGESSTPAPGSAPCGECANCKRALDNQWLDFEEIRPEASSSSSSNTHAIRIDQFERIRSSQGFSAHESPFRIVLIDRAERMTPQAANSLLKILEEPPKGWIFFLTASDPSLLLPTVVSRCQLLRLRPLDTETLKSLLKEKSVLDSRLQTCLRFAEGSLSKALALSEDSLWEKRETLYQFISTPENHLNPLVDWASQDPIHLGILLDQLEQIVLDLLTERRDPRLDPHRKSIHQKLGTNPHPFWQRCANRIQRTRRRLNAPLNRKLLAQDALFPWLHITSNVTN